MGHQEAIIDRSRQRAAIVVGLSLCAWGPAARGHVPCFGSGPSFIQDTGLVVLPRLEGAVVLDGRSDETAWMAIPPLPLTMHLPTFAGDPTERTEIRIAVDRNFLYASGRFYDSDPGAIRANSRYRDRLSGDDTFGIVIDTFNDNENALSFEVTPAGVRVDRSIGGDGATTNPSWNTFWDAKTVITPEGWFAEVRIPLSGLRIQSRGGRAILGITVTRLIARKNELVTYPAIDGRFTVDRPSVAQDMLLETGPHPQPAYVTPYALSGVDRNQTLNPEGTRFESDARMIRELGGDVQYNVAENITVNLSANTDFAQVEADDEQINLTRFSLFFPEKRRFFQEGSGVFDFSLSAGGRLFHSRRIGLTEAGRPVRILGGGRLVGRVGEWDVGVLDVQAAAHDTAGGENFGVARIRRRVFNPFSYVGGMVTTRVDTRGRSSVGLGVDGVLRVIGDEYLTVKWAETHASDDTAASRWERGHLFVHWQRRTERGLTYFAQINRAGPGYDPRVGFANRHDFTRMSLYAQYGWFQPAASRMRQWMPGVISNLQWRNEDGSLHSAYFAHWWQFETKHGTGGWIEPRLLHEDVRMPFSFGGDTRIPAGSYWFPDMWLNFNTAPGGLFRAGLDAQVGGFYDGWRMQLRATPTWNVSHALELSGSYQLAALGFPDRDQSVVTHLARVRVGFAATAKLSANTFVQFNSLSGRFTVNARTRYNFREGNDLWIVYDEGLNTDRGIGGAPRMPLSVRRSILIKFSHTLIVS